MRNEGEYTCIWVSCCYFVIKTKAQHENTHPEHQLSQCLVCNNEKKEDVVLADVLFIYGES